MGNNSSATALGQGGGPKQWAPRPQSLDPEDPMNRIRKGYLAKQYVGHRAAPQKVLPTVNPSKAAKKLKPTSNGRNLKTCGTISGRKLNDGDVESCDFGDVPIEEMSRIRLGPVQDRISRTENSGPLSRQNGFSSPNLHKLQSRDFPTTSGLGRQSTRNLHDSEPELHSRRNESPPQVPMSHGALAQESAAKKQLRMKKKKSAPAPPMVTKAAHASRISKSPPPPLTTQEVTKVHQRIFKPKADRKLSYSSIEGRQNSGATSSPQSVASSASVPKSPSSTPNIIRMRNEKIKSQKQTVTSSESVPAPKHYLPYTSRASNNKLGERQSTRPVSKSSNQLKSENVLTQNSVTENQRDLPEKKRFYFGMDIVDFGGKPSRPNLNDLQHNIPQNDKNQAPPPLSAHHFYKSKDLKEDSLSDNLSSSSEMDIVLRPTLPPKPQQLPKFSPSAAWNRIDLDSPNSSEEDGLRFNSRKDLKGLPVSQIVKERLGEGDSGISGLDGDGGGSPEILPPPLPIASSLSKGPCWTPEQDLDDSSSEFEEEDEDDSPRDAGSAFQNSAERPRLTTRSNFFTSSRSDSEQIEQPRSKAEPIYACSTKSKAAAALSRETTPSEVHPLEFKPSLNRIINYRRTQRVNKEVGLDANWFLSRSEPNSLNMTHLMVGAEAGPCGRDCEEEEGIRSENGYAPTGLSFEIAGTSPAEWNKSASLISLSHFVYLPQQRSAYDDSTTTKRNRRAKSVENLLKQNDQPKMLDRKLGESQLASESHSGQNNYKRKKFKFQSTLKVMERKRIEKELSREAEGKEIERLKEIEAMKRVEEEFQRKRKCREKELEEKAALQNLSPRKVSPSNVSLVTPSNQWEDHQLRSKQRSQPSRTATPCQFSDNSSNRSVTNVTKVNLNKRQDPEGAPSAHDLRKELILGAKKRNGISSASSDLTQELSEFRQERRQYCDYRSSPRLNTDRTNNSKTRNKFVDSTSSDIYPLSGKMPAIERTRQRPKSTVVYPEIVCDIPNKPFPYTVNFSRLSGSHTSLLIEERPTSGVGFASGPSSVISDNYRKDWAHPHGSKHSGSTIGNGGKSSSITSLHNAGKSSSITSLHSTSDNLRLHHSELDEDAAKSPRIVHRVFGARNSRQRETNGPTTVTITMNSNQGIRLNETSATDKVDGLPKLRPETCLQPQSFISYKTKSYRPVIFNPANSRPH